jgi:hypothetical protein
VRLSMKYLAHCVNVQCVELCKRMHLVTSFRQLNTVGAVFRTFIAALSHLNTYIHKTHATVGDCTLVDVEFEDAHWANPELTPVAIVAGQLLAGRLFGKQTDKMDYTKVS